MKTKKTLYLCVDGGLVDDCPDNKNFAAILYQKDGNSDWFYSFNKEPSEKDRSCKTLDWALDFIEFSIFSHETSKWTN